MWYSSALASVGFYDFVFGLLADPKVLGKEDAINFML